MERPKFEKFDLNNLEDYYAATVRYGERELEIDINFEVQSTDQQEINKILEFISNIPSYDSKNEIYIHNDLNKNPSVTQDYLLFYTEELEDDLQNIIEKSDEMATNISRLREKLNLIRVGIYPQADYFATFDYSIDLDGEPCEQLLVININADGSLDYITWES
jgi:hypothetical protein